jgi:hypothetical protein
MEKQGEIGVGSFIPIAILTAIFIVLLSLFFSIGKYDEILNNWDKYRSNPLFMMTAFLYKPAGDMRSRFQFMQDNFLEQFQTLLSNVLRMVIAPILDIFNVVQMGIIGSIGGVINIQEIILTAMNSFNGIFRIFENRYKSILYRLAMGFQRIQTSMSRVWAVAVNSVYQSMSTIAAILSTLDLIIKIIIIILVILVAIILFLFLFLWPVIPVVLGVIGILVTAGMGAAVGGMAATFCFDGTTPVILADGTTKPMAAVRIGEELGEGCGKVTARLQFQQYVPDLYNLRGIRVTGSHIVWNAGKPIPVSQHPEATLLPPVIKRIYCLNTASHKIPVRTMEGDSMLFADWEELGDEDQLTWNRHVFGELNPGFPWNSAEAVTDSEAAFHPSTLVQTGLHQWIEISRLRPGDTVLDEEGRSSRVLGIVELANTEVVGGPISTGVWRRMNGRECWKQGNTAATTATTATTFSANADTYYSLITDRGTFRLITGECVRDFTDVGIHKIGETYGWVLDALLNGVKNPTVQ